MAKRCFHWDVVDDFVTHESDGAGATIVTYTNEISHFGPLLTASRDGTEYYHHYDALGSTAIISDETGVTTDTFTYDAWGGPIGGSHFTARHYQWCGRYGYSYHMPDTYYVRARFYRHSLSRWTSKDPSGFADGPNVFAYLPNNPVSFMDPSGLDFIAEADRPVKLSGGNFFHYSLQYWKCCVTVPEDVMTVADLLKHCPEAQKLASMELIAVNGLCCDGFSRLWRRWVSYFPVSFGYIQFTDTSKRLLPIYQPQEPNLVKLVWNGMLTTAANYKWAERSADPRLITKWPNSHYLAFRTNSNTFVRYVVAENGLFFLEMPGSHPGNFHPTTNPPPRGATFDSFHRPHHCN